jgi:malate dehydrogenase
LGLFDIVNTPGVAADLSHIATPAKVEGYLPLDDGLKKTLQGADIVVIPAGVPRKPGVSLQFLLASDKILMQTWDHR